MEYFIIPNETAHFLRPPARYYPSNAVRSPS
jgi:hypothetical protein